MIQRELGEFFCVCLPTKRRLGCLECQKDVTRPRTGDFDAPLVVRAYVNGDFDLVVLEAAYGDAANNPAVDALDAVRSVDGPGVPYAVLLRIPQAIQICCLICIRVCKLTKLL